MSPGGASALDKLVLETMRVGTQAASPGPGLGWPEAWPAECKLAMSGVMLIANLSRQADGEPVLNRREMVSGGPVPVRSGVAGAMDVVSLVMDARYPGCIGEYPIGPLSEVYRIPGATWQAWKGMGPGPVHTEPWLWRQVEDATICLNVEDPGEGDPGSIVLSGSLAGDESTGKPGIRATGIWEVRRHVVSVSVVESRRPGPGGRLEKETWGSMQVGELTREEHAGGRTMEVEQEAREERLLALVRGGVAAHAVNVARRLAAERDGSLSRLEAQPGRGPASSRMTRARARKAMRQADRAGEARSLLRQWRLPDVPRRGGGGGGETCTGEATGRKLRTAHGVGGHWKRQAYGPRRRRRKWIHVAPYWRGVSGAEGEVLEWVLPQWTDAGVPAWEG